ncbi:Fe2+-enterobactin ABC transporter substrate-binding protein [Psychromonas sp. 14N.309.X.WAT.B.A12]|uniref:Fe2+-enterobactin ABC transporter substrate-binding protein n=1 Tax=Psychromonas sp. 14N.309.X.WAT.B.A12 TaxID=2998322 RepID=UPI0025B1D0A2|nr:Fe2+-enterobactin ABC transporter substrate-binding protein [Psychromonas sp. 14N.309.X.WAT.B.A12]MDN2662333.1 Fe2+-enterobactin ABC transporter substrate-binding protein [Psychromonas sp. 14N.309.X.WAT.B.A12]
MIRLLVRPFLIVFTGLVLASCGDPQETSSTLAIDQIEKDPSGWPRSIMTSQGLITLAKPPQRIVSTSVTLSGTLLAIDAPLVASGATMPNTNVASEKGFMRQWDTIAEQRGVKALYQSEPNAEAIIKAQPDVIIISATGADSAMRLYDQLKDIAPTLVIRYDDKSWIQLAQTFGNLFGLETQAESVINSFQQQVEQTKQNITLPEQPTTAMVYTLDDSGASIWTSQSAQGRLLETLGFTLATVPESIKGDISMGVRNDIIIAKGERFPDAVTGKSILLFAAEKAIEQQVLDNPFLQSNQAVENKQVYAVGSDTFRLDYYSASNLLTRLQSLFGSNND